MTGDQVWRAALTAGFVALVVLGVYMSKTQLKLARQVDAEARGRRAAVHDVLMRIEHRGGDHFKRRGVLCPLCPPPKVEGHEAFAKDHSAVMIPAPPIVAEEGVVSLSCSCGTYTSAPAPESEALAAWVDHVREALAAEVP